LTACPLLKAKYPPNPTSDAIGTAKRIIKMAPREVCLNSWAIKWYNIPIHIGGAEIIKTLLQTNIS
jgi:hypothetical protein